MEELNNPIVEEQINESSVEFEAVTEEVIAETAEVTETAEAEVNFEQNQEEEVEVNFEQTENEVNVDAEDSIDSATEEVSEFEQLRSDFESLQNSFNDLQNRYETLESTNSEAQNAFAARCAEYEAQVQNLTEQLNAANETISTYSAQAAQVEIDNKNNLIDSYSDMLNEDEIAPIREQIDSFSLAEIESKLAVTFAHKNMREKSSLRAPVVEEEESSFAKLMKKYKR